MEIGMVVIAKERGWRESESYILSSTLTYGQTSDERIARVSRRASTYRAVINDFASGAYSACSRTRVHTLLIIASLVGKTLRTGDALGPTARRAS